MDDPIESPPKLEDEDETLLDTIWDGLASETLSTEKKKGSQSDHGIQFSLKPGWTVPKRKVSHFGEKSHGA